MFPTRGDQYAGNIYLKKYQNWYHSHQKYVSAYQEYSSTAGKDNAKLFTSNRCDELAENHKADQVDQFLKLTKD